MGRYLETMQIAIDDSCLQNLFLWCLPISIMPPAFLTGIYEEELTRLPIY